MMGPVTEHDAFLRTAAVTSVLDATLLATASAKLGRQLAEPQAEISELTQLSERLAEFLKFVTLAEGALKQGHPNTASYLGGFQREMLAACDRVASALERHELDTAATELDWIAAILGDYPTFGAEVAIALRHRPSAA